MGVENNRVKEGVMLVTRGRSLGLIGAALLLPGCGARSAFAVRVGSRNTAEDTTIAEMYALALERAKIPVDRHMNIGDAATVLAALKSGDVHLCPGYVQTVNSPVWQGTPVNVGIGLNMAEKPQFEREYGLTWLTPAPMEVSPSLATSTYAAEQFSLLTLEKCARLASELRLAATAAFLAPHGMLEHLQRYYGGFAFKSVLTVDPGKQYDALGRGDADVANAFTTDAQIAEDRLIVLSDQKHFWPTYSVAPVVRLASLRAHPRLASVLNRVSRSLSTYAVQQTTMHLDLLSREPRDEAEYFLNMHRKPAD